MPSVALAVSQGLREGLVARLRQQENADDADEGAAGEDDVVKEVALLIVELHNGGGEHAKAGAGQDQAQTATPTRRWKMLHMVGFRIYDHTCL